MSCLVRVSVAEGAMVKTKLVPVGLAMSLLLSLIRNLGDEYGFVGI